jgi:hypothetical protein
MDGFISGCHLRFEVRWSLSDWREDAAGAKDEAVHVYL